MPTPTCIGADSAPGIIAAAKLREGTGSMVGYIILPWLDADGNEIYATGRSYTGQEPKYKYAPGERPPLFASPGAWESARVALVEGQIDALLCAQAGNLGICHWWRGSPISRS